MSSLENIKKDIISRFPDCDLIPSNFPKVVFNHCIDDLNSYHLIFDYIDKEIESYWKIPNRSENKEEYTKRFNYIYGKYDKKTGKESYSIYSWSKEVEDYYLLIHGKKHTFKEACQLAADKWCELIFGYQIQDNGAINETHSGGFMSCALGTILKNDLSKFITDEMKSNANKLIYEYIYNGCTYTFEDGHQFCLELSVDYGPNSALYDLLKEAGIEEKNISNICPWKTSIKVDHKDNSVIIYQHGNVEYI